MRIRRGSRGGRRLAVLTRRPSAVSTTRVRPAKRDGPATRSRNFTMFEPRALPARPFIDRATKYGFHVIEHRREIELRGDPLPGRRQDPGGERRIAKQAVDRGGECDRVLLSDDEC